MTINPHSPLKDGILTREEITLLLEQPDCESAMGLRDRTMMEVLYWTAMRAAELVELSFDDVDRVHEILTIRSRRFGDRQVPLRKHLLDYLDRYINESRPTFFSAEKSRILFISYYGRALNKGELWRILKRYVQSAGIEKTVTTHKIRHASLLHHFIRRGSDI